jgi:hypothetical protein
MNKYLKIVNSRLNKRLSKLEVKYFHMTESTINLKNIRKDNLSKAFLDLSEQLQKFITVDDLIDYIKLGKPIINYDKLNGILRNENEKIGIIVFDTETTGLVGKSGGKNNTIRNQIYELAAITYDYSLEETKEGDRVDYFHAKVPDESLNGLNSVSKLIIKIKSNLKSNLKRDVEVEKINPSKSLSEIDIEPETEITLMEKAYQLAIKDNKYNPDFKIFKDKLPKDFEYVAHDLMKMLKIKSLREMTKADKMDFFDFWTKEAYKVKMYKNEILMIHDFFSYIERQEKKFDKIYILAHNLDFDKNIVLGAIQDVIEYWKKKNDNPEMVAKSEILLTKANTLFSSMNTSDTLNGFKTLFNEKQYINKIELLVKELKVYMSKRQIPDGEKGFVSKLLILLTKIPKTKDPKFRSTSLGSVAPKGLNVDWHTAVNDVFVTVRTTKMYFTMPMIISLLIKISETYENSKTIPVFSKIKIPLSLIRFAIKTKFHQAYNRVKKQVEAANIEAPFWGKNKELDETKKTNPNKVYTYKITHPDFPDITDKESLVAEKPELKNNGKELLRDLAIERDFVGVDTEILKAEKTGKMPALQNTLEKMGVNIPVKELHNIAKDGGFLAVDENTLVDKLSQDNKNIYNALANKQYYIVSEYKKAQKNKQGAQYMANIINRKYSIPITKEIIISMLKEMGVKK